MSQKLLGDFSGVTKTEWQEKIIAELKGKPFENLQWSDKGVDGGPAYGVEDLNSIENLDTLQNHAINQNVEIQGHRHWINYQQIECNEESQANKIALAALNSGADGILFQVSSIPDFKKLLKEIQPEYCAVSFESPDRIEGLLIEYSNYLKSAGVDQSKITGSFIGQEEISIQDFDALQGSTFKSVNIGLPTEFKDVNVVQELALLLNISTTEITRFVELSKSAEDIFDHLQYQLRLGNTYFVEIAKVRAMRVLASLLMEGFDTRIEPQQVCLLSSSGTWQEEVEDEHNYLLSATTSAMSAIIGGCNALLIKPFYSTFPDEPELAVRNARNISSILKDESYLDKVVDPSAGSYLIELITKQIVERAWKVFLSIEKLGSDYDMEQLESLTEKVSNNEA